MTEAITQILYPVVEWCHALTGNWWIAILLFTAITKVLLLPLSLWSHRNSITMVELMPDLFAIKMQFFGDREAIEEKQNELYKERHYHALLSLVPLAVQIVILFGLSGVIRTIVQSGDAEVALLGIVPSEQGFPFLPIVPVLAGLSSLAQGLAANRINPLQREQSRAEKATTNGISIALSFFLAAFVVCGMAFYWICSNLMAIVVQLACNAIIRPANYIDYEALGKARGEYEALESSTASQRKWYERDPYARRERDDYKRFLSIHGKHLVFYSEGSGFYKYFKGAIEWLLNHSDIQIHYITGDPNDQVFGIAEHEPRLLPYYIGQRRLITLMMKMDADVVVMSTPDLENYYIKRSYVRKDSTYVYMPHHTTSFTMLASSFQSYEHFDEVFCVGPHQAAELAAEEEMFHQRKKNLPLIGYDLIDDEIRAYEAGEHEGAHVPPVVLIAPSWAPDNILDSCIDDMLEVLLAREYRIIVRPHPEYTKRYRPKWDALLSRYAHIPDERLHFEKDFSSNESILEADTIITDWSTVNLEFSFTTLKPSIFIDTAMKVMNPDWEQLGMPATEISIRNEIGRSLAPDALDGLPALIDDYVAHPDTWSAEIAEVRSRMISNLGHGAEKAGERLLELVLEHQGGEERGEQTPVVAEADDTVDVEPEAADDTGIIANEVTAIVHVRNTSKHLVKHGPQHLSPSDLGCVLLGVLVATLAIPRPALAYVDPSVMTYAIQALAAVAVALSAVLGVAFRKTRSFIFKLLHIDERAGLISEPPVHRITPHRKLVADQEAIEAREAAAREFAKRQVRVPWIMRLVLSVLAVGLVVFTVLVVAPVELVATNSSSLVYGVDMVWGPLIRVALIAVGSVSLVLSIVRGRPFHVLLALVCALGLAAYLESLFFARLLPLADGTPVDWGSYAFTTIESAVLWIAVIAACIVFAIKKPQVARACFAIAALVLIIIQTAGIASLSRVEGAGEELLMEDEPEITADNYRNVATELGLFDVSQQSNVIVFVLDMTDTSYIRELLDGYYPKILDGLEGFTFYENSAGGMIPTRYGVALLLTGSTPKEGQMMFEYVEDRYPSSSFLSDISELGYTIGLYTNSLGMNDRETFVPASYSINNHDASESVEVFSASFNEQGALQILYQCALYRHLPWVFKPSFWYYTDDINRAMTITSTQQVEGDETLYQTDDVAYFEKLKERGLRFNDEPASFRFIHLNGSHWPYTMSRYGLRQDRTSRDWREQCIGSFAIVKTYLEELKRLGIYEQTTIIITADHGIWHPVDSDELEPIDEPTSPIIFVKPAQTVEEAARPCIISHAPVTIVDLQPTILEAMGADRQTVAAYGRPIDEISENENRPRYFYMLDREVKEDGTSGDDEGLWEYVIDGDPADFENWEFTGNINPRNNTYYQERGIL